MSRDTARACLVTLLLISSEGTASAVFSPFLQGIGLGLSDMGLVIAIFSFVSLGTRIPSGLLFKRWGALWVMRVSLILFTVSLLGYAISPDGGLVALFRVGHGIAYALSTTVNFAHFIGLAARDRSRGRAMGMFAAAQAAGRTIGNFAGGWVADQAGFGGVFLLAALFPLLAVLVLPTQKMAEEKRPAALSSNEGAAPRPLMERLLSITNAAVVTQTIITFTMNFLYQQIWSYFPIYALGVGLSMTSIGALRGINALVGIATRPFTGEMIRGLGYNLVANVALIGGAFFVAVTPAFQDFWSLVVLLSIGGIVRGAISVTNGLAIIEATEGDPEKRGMAAAIFNTGEDMGGIVGPIVGGVVASSIGIANMFIFMPVLVVGIYLALISMVRLQQRRKTGRPIRVS